MKKYYFTVLFVFCSYFFAFAESGKTDQDFKYRRSSLHKVLIQSETFPKKDVVMNAADGKFDMSLIVMRNIQPGMLLKQTK